MAKIFAKAVNCLDPQEGNPCNKCNICQGINDGSLLDVMEIDAASHNSVDNIRRITDEVVFMPSQAKYKVYIIDEVHMLSSGAFNALLKTLEEPPAHAIFILATTEPQRIPATILSRCQRFEFRRIPLEDIIERLKDIASADQIDISEEAIYTIARLGDGALRDAISLLDQAKSGIQGEIRHDDVLAIAGVVRDDFLAKFTEQVIRADLNGLLESIDDLQMSGRNLQRFLQDFLAYLRDLLVVKLSQRPDQLINQSLDGIKQLQSLSDLISQDEIVEMIDRLSKVNNEMRWSGDPKTTLELAFISEIAKFSARPESPRLEEPIPKRTHLEPTPSVVSPEPAVVEAKAEPSAVKPEPVQKKDSFLDALSLGKEEPEQASKEEKPASPAEKEIPSLSEYEAPTASAEEPPVPSEEEPAEPIEEEPAEPVEKDQARSIETESGQLWQNILEELRNLSRYDMVMLIKPAQIFIEDNEIKVVYANEQKAHYETMSQADNVEVLNQASRAAGMTNPKINFVLGDGKESQDGNLNPDEPLWVQKLRQGSQVHGLEFRIEDEEVKKDNKDKSFYDFAIADDDRLPY